MTNRFEYNKIYNVKTRGDKMKPIEKLNLMKQRLKNLETSGKNTKSPGVVRALKREIRVLENSISEDHSSN